MANMSYCRMENTYNDLKDVYNHLDDEDLSESEKKFRNKIIELAKEISFDAEHKIVL